MYSKLHAHEQMQRLREKAELECLHAVKLSTPSGTCAATVKVAESAVKGHRLQERSVAGTCHLVKVAVKRAA